MLFRSADVGVLYTDVEGTWERKTFASRADNVVISYMYQSTMGHKISTSISIDDIKTIRGYGRGAEVGLNVAVEVSEDARRILQYAKYPIYDGSELNGGGYCGITYVVSDGLQQVSGKMIRVHDASYVALITKSDRSFDLNSDNIYERLCSDIENVILKYTEANGRFNYDKAIHESSIIHDEMYKQVYFKLGEDYKKVVYNEDIILSQKGKSELSNDLVERVYAQGRYAMICCAGKTMSRLCGMWTGEFNSGWNGIYTMDANEIGRAHV